MLAATESPVIPPACSSAHPAAMPGWALPRGREPDELAAAFAAGIALKSLDDLVRTAPVWAGCWRARQALKCVAVAVRLMGRTGDEAALRGAVLLTAAGDDSGPVGRVFLAHRRVCARKPAFSSKVVAELVDVLGLAGDDRLTAAVDLPSTRCNPAGLRRSPRRTWSPPSRPPGRMRGRSAGKSFRKSKSWARWTARKRSKASQPSGIATTG